MFKSLYLKRNSFKVYLESNGLIGEKISMEEINKSSDEMEKRAVKNAKANGLFANAQENAKLIVSNIVYQVYDPNEYAIEFNFK